MKHLILIIIKINLNNAAKFKNCSECSRGDKSKQLNSQSVNEPAIKTWDKWGYGQIWCRFLKLGHSWSSKWSR